MKKQENKGIDIEIDFIGTQPTKLTKEEERMISEYIRSQKAKMRLKQSKDKVDQ